MTRRKKDRSMTMLSLLEATKGEYDQNTEVDPVINSKLKKALSDPTIAGELNRFKREFKKSQRDSIMNLTTELNKYGLSLDQAFIGYFNLLDSRSENPPFDREDLKYVDQEEVPRYGTVAVRSARSKRRQRGIESSDQVSRKLGEYEDDIHNTQNLTNIERSFPTSFSKKRKNR